MLRLILMRHAKSSWRDESLSDHERPLNKRGREDAPRVAARIKKLGWTPQLIFSSDSQRTKETLELMRPEFDSSPEVKFTRDLYLADIEAVREFCRDLPKTTETIMMLGHNPGWEEAVPWLSKAPTRMTTSNAALMQCNFEWYASVEEAGRWDLVDVIRPKDLD